MKVRRSLSLSSRDTHALVPLYDSSQQLRSVLLPYPAGADTSVSGL